MFMMQHMSLQQKLKKPFDGNNRGNSLLFQEFIQSWVGYELVKVKVYARAKGVSAGFGVDSESASDLSRGIGVSEMAECWEKVQCTSARPHVDLVPGGNGTGMRLAHADT
jgi:hypothetical protein